MITKNSSRSVVDSVKGGFSSFSQATHSAAGAVVSKPREIASLIRNKFGSADNIPNLKDSLEEGQVDDGGKALGVISNFQSSPKYGSEEDCSSATSGSVGANSTTGGIAVGASSSKTNTLDMQSSGFDALLHEVQEIRETQARLEDSFETLKEHYQRDYSLIMQTLQEERYRCERHDVQQIQTDPEPEVDLDSQNACAEFDGVSTHPTALNRVLQQIRVPPKMKRGTSLHSRRGKSEAPKGSPQINRKSGQEVAAVIQSGRPRSSSTTDAPTSSSVMEIACAAGVCVPGEEATAERIERLEVSSLAQTSSAVASSTDGSIHTESVDGIPDPQRTKAAIAHLQQKILKLTEQIKIAQTARDDNVAEYLKLANSADKQQAARIKQVFEKKNQKSAQTILQLQKKLEHYHRKLREVEQNGIPRQPKDVFRDMHQGLKDVGAKVTGFSEGVVDSYT